MDHVLLSKRNLLTLLAKLEIPGSNCTIIKPGGIVVTAVPDEVAYADREPGPITEDTERIIDRWERFLTL
jgi:hypothetical protein